MNLIATKQNEQKQLERLAAQRELYSSAKKYHIFQITLTVILPIVFAFTSFKLVNISVFAAIFGVLSFLIDIAFIEPIIDRKKNKAAKIQELFDCDVLELEKSPLKTVDDIKVEEVLSYYDAHIKIASNIEKIRDWYSPSVSSLPLHIARILCQRTNCWWDSKLRVNYSSFLKFLGVIVFSIILIGSYIADLSLINFTLTISSLIPFFQFSIKQYNDNIETASRLDRLVSFSGFLWEKALSRFPIDEITGDARKLQDEIYEHRRKSPLILDFIYKRFRDKDELLMNRSSKMLVDEALGKINQINTI